ncbi:hypothetical protein LZC95_29945 [Pendulispora brunnea]|uniref:Kazal-like domain-containing protein n=1 Tax=Pendulispora brunnea TaxID=2905690 RepID=A0ABZ2JW14_9BACT
MRERIPSMIPSSARATILSLALVALGAVACSSSADSPAAMDVRQDSLAAVPETCPEIEDALKAWAASHRSCNEDSACAYIPDLDSVNICEVVSPGNDRPELDALLTAWKEKGCSAGGMCGHAPGKVACENGTCQWKMDTSCQDCPDNLDPVCTTRNQNAINECYAKNCLHDPEIAHRGFCEDSAECKAARGTCNEWLSVEDPLCPDGTRWEGAFWTPEATKGCAGGNFQNTCCTKWYQPCSYIGGTMTLSVDPFTCQPPPREQGAPWTCLHTEQKTCVMQASLSQPFNPSGDYNAHISIVARYGNKVTVRGFHYETGRRFRCTGKVSYDISHASEWSCEACDGNDCTTCTAEQTYLCRL